MDFIFSCINKILQSVTLKARAADIRLDASLCD